ncbi:serine/threonine protein phosphatase PP2A-associated protein [Crepidotus variabilis]|uniref:Serine/threonine protein phosphatase PP2A-associated protein n=1 Tax=Crepidotus variabilis TaxID=179855 RepID=A0A9P6EDT5_9AGAR|nr:serine/threonine protein phosphatase PP2A-associated protein [Crepidotus variabilis]
MAPTMSVSLSALYSRILRSASKASTLSTIEDETQVSPSPSERNQLTRPKDIITNCLNDLKTIHTRIIDLSIFSPNETLDDISSKDLVYLSVPYTFSEVQSRLKTTDRTQRLNNVLQVETYAQNFIGLLEKYNVVPEEEQKLYGKNATKVSDFAKKRQLKIDQFKKEKDIKARLEKLRAQGLNKQSLHESSTDYDLLASLLPSPGTLSSQDETVLDFDTDDILRETTLLLLRLFYARASSQLQSLEQELELLRNAPPSPTNDPNEMIDDPRDKKRIGEDNAWKLDIPVPGGPDGKGPLMDASGKPLRPFTILPSDAGERARLQATVFGPGHNLPTMSVDEYLEIERQRGKFISGGGPASENVPTGSEQLALDSEMDGTIGGEDQAEHKRQKDESWARYTEENPRGAGNTMNRG